MTIRFLSLFAPLAAIMIAPAAAADEGVVASPPACSVADSPKMTIGEMISLGDAARGRCAALDGWAIGDTLHADNAARYRPQRVYNDYSSTGAILGLYGRTSWSPPAIVHVVGRIGNCDALSDHRKAVGPDAVLGGYCADHRGLFIDAAEVVEAGAPDRVRLTANSAPGFGNLAPMAQGAARDRLAAAFEPLLSALRMRDRDALQRLLVRQRGGSPVVSFGTASRWDQRVEMLTADDAPVPPLDDAKVEIFGWRVPLWADDETVAGNRADMKRTVQGIACAAPRADADAGAWPISDVDIAVAPGRPYVCADITINAAGAARYGIAHDRNPAREPGPG